MDAPWLAMAAWLIAASLVGLVIAAIDKRQAQRGLGRVPEAALLALALLGGWPGELVAFLVVRHKTRKAAFLVPFVLCALVNGLVLAWLLGVRPG